MSEQGCDRNPQQRARLVAALDRAAEEWESSWTARLRTTVGASRPWATAALVVAVVFVSAMALGSRLRSESATTRASAVHRESLPLASLTPGAVTSIGAADLCAGARPSRRVTADVRDRVLRSYNMNDVPDDAYELDALITPELGGSTEPRNLWPQRYESPVWNARVKDALEQLLPTLVCDGKVDLAVAQRDIARDWIAAYRKYFNTDVPLQAHVGPPREDDDDLEIVPAVYQTVARR